MSQVITFEDYIPVPRYDSVPWTQALVEEGAASSGPWSEIDTIDLDPVDADPSQPQPRNFTTANASDALGLWYRVTFLDADGNFTQPADPFQNRDVIDLYVGEAEVKAQLVLTGTTFADREVADAVAAASRAVDAECRRRFWLDAESVERAFSANGETLIDIGDLTTVEDATVTLDGIAATAGTDYDLEPLNAPADGRPYTRIRLIKAPFSKQRGGVKIEGRWGWETVPANAKTAAKIIAAALIVRMRQAPMGILVAGIDSAVAMRLARTDPQVISLLRDYRRDQDLDSLRLG